MSQLACRPSCSHLANCWPDRPLVVLFFGFGSTFRRRLALDNRSTVVFQRASAANPPPFRQFGACVRAELLRADSQASSWSSRPSLPRRPRSAGCRACRDPPAQAPIAPVRQVQSLFDVRWPWLASLAFWRRRRRWQRLLPTMPRRRQRQRRQAATSSTTTSNQTSGESRMRPRGRAAPGVGAGPERHCDFALERDVLCSFFCRSS